MVQPYPPKRVGPFSVPSGSVRIGRVKPNSPAGYSPTCGPVVSANDGIR